MAPAAGRRPTVRSARDGAAGPRRLQARCSKPVATGLAPDRKPTTVPGPAARNRFGAGPKSPKRTPGTVRFAKARRDGRSRASEPVVPVCSASSGCGRWRSRRLCADIRVRWSRWSRNRWRSAPRICSITGPNTGPNIVAICKPRARRPGSKRLSPGFPPCRRRGRASGRRVDGSSPSGAGRPAARPTRFGGRGAGAAHVAWRMNG